MEMYKFFPNYAIWYNSHMFLPYITNPFIDLRRTITDAIRKEAKKEIFEWLQ